MTEGKTIEEVYADRNAAVVALAEAIRRLGLERPNSTKYRAWWAPDDGNDADADEWAVIYVSLASSQVSWHVPRRMAESSCLPCESPRWDGHTRDEKNERLRSWALSDK